MQRQVPDWVWGLGVGLVLGALTCWLLAMSWADRQRSELQHWADSTAAVHARDSSVLADRARNLSLARQEIEHDRARWQQQALEDSAAARRAWRDARLARQQRDSALAALALAPEVEETVRQIIADADRRVDNAEEAAGRELDSWKERLGAEVRRANLADSTNVILSLQLQESQAYAGQLATKLQSLTKPSKKWLGFIPKPSGEALFLIGVGLGVVVSR